MALTSTMHRFAIELSDVDRGVYESFEVPLALHPSESVSFAVVRLLAFALEYRDQLAFGRGIGAADEPAISAPGRHGTTALWVDIGAPSADRLHKAAKRADDVAVSKVYEFRGQGFYYSQPLPTQQEENVGVYLKLKNEAANQMGMPLPGGIMRVYQPDSDGMLQFSGEDRIEHTAKDEEVTLRLGNAFDVVGERVQTDYSRIAPTVHESGYTITLRNHKEEAITVEVVENLQGDWQMLSASLAHVKKDARTAVFSVPVPADGEVELSYRVRVAL